MTDDTTTRLLERLAETVPDQPAPLATLLGAARAGRRRRARRNAALVVGALVLAVGAGAGFQQALPDDGTQRSDRVADTGPDPSVLPCDKNNPVPPSEPIPRGPDYPTNATGQTYGRAMDNAPQPDLVSAIGDCGRTGYIERDRFEEPPPWVPGAGSKPQSFPVYESDGITQIDTFTQDPGTTVADGVTNPPATSDGPDAADLQGRWTATIAGSSHGEKDAYDTYRDLDLWIAFYADDRIQVHDGCQTLDTGVTVERGAFTLASPFDLVLGGAHPDCEGSAPLTAILDNVRHVTQSGGRTYLHLADFRIALVLTRR